MSQETIRFNSNIFNNLKLLFVQFYLKIASYFLSWGKYKYVTLGMRLLWKYIKN